MLLTKPWPAEKLFPQRAFCILGLVPAAALKFGHEHVDNIEEGFWPDRKRHVEAVNARVVDPLLKLVGNGSWRARDHRANAADRNVFRDFPHGPAPARISARDVLHRRAPGFAVHMIDDLIG